MISRLICIKRKGRRERKGREKWGNTKKGEKRRKVLRKRGRDREKKKERKRREGRGEKCHFRSNVT